SEAQGHETRARGIDDAALAQEPTVRELLSTLNVADTQAPEAHLRAQTAAEDARRIAERHPGLIGNNLDWPARQMEFQRVFSEWRERHNVALEARRRAGAELPPRLEQLKHDIARYKEVPDVIKTGQQAEEAMRREEAMAERARSRQRTFLGAMLGGLLLTALAILVAFLALQSTGTIIRARAAFFLLGMGVLSTGIGIWVRGAAVREVDRRLRSKDQARMRRLEVAQPWRVRSSPGWVSPAARRLAPPAISSPAAKPPGRRNRSARGSSSSTPSWSSCGRRGSARPSNAPRPSNTPASLAPSIPRRASPRLIWNA